MSLFSSVKSLSPLWQFLSRRRRIQLFALLVLSFFTAISEAANIGALVPFLRILSKPDQGLDFLGPFAEPLRELSSINLLLLFGFGFILIVVISNSLRLLALHIQQKLTALITADLSHQVYATILRKPYDWHLLTNSSTVISYLSRDVSAVYVGLQGTLLFCMNIAIVILLSGSLIALAPAVMVPVGCLLGIFYFLLFRSIRPVLKSNGAISLQEYRRSVQIIQESLGGIRDIILDQSYSSFIDAFDVSNNRQKQALAKINIKSQEPRFIIESFAMIVIIVVSLVLALLGQGIDRQIPLLGAMALGSYRLLQPLQQCFAASSNLVANETSFIRLAPFLRKEKALVSDKHSSSFLEDGNEFTPIIRIKNVSFRYSPETPWVLKDIDLVIHPGERIAFIGSTGSGKSTTIDLILGLLKPTKGIITVNDVDIHASPTLIMNWQANLAHVPQQIYLSDSSFAENIAFGMTMNSLDMNLVRKSAKQACISSMIESTSNGYQTLVGERGIRLSGGQRQRLGIARAFYKQTKLLILDEATSALDNQTEAEVMNSIQSLDRSMTVIIIAHRLSTVKYCDRILMLDEGRIVDNGTYDTLEKESLHFQKFLKKAFTAET